MVVVLTDKASGNFRYPRGLKAQRANPIAQHLRMRIQPASALEAFLAGDQRRAIDSRMAFSNDSSLNGLCRKAAAPLIIADVCSLSVACPELKTIGRPTCIGRQMSLQLQSTHPRQTNIEDQAGSLIPPAPSEEVFGRGMLLRL